MQRDKFVKVILEHPYYSKKFNNTEEFVRFPSSFGICSQKNKWVFYEVDEREKISKIVFNTEEEAYRCAFKKYGLEPKRGKIVSETAPIMQKSIGARKTPHKTLLPGVRQKSQRNDISKDIYLEAQVPSGLLPKIAEDRQYAVLRKASHHQGYLKASRKKSLRDMRAKRGKKN